MGLFSSSVSGAVAVHNKKAQDDEKFRSFTSQSSHVSTCGGSVYGVDGMGGGSSFLGCVERSSGTDQHFSRRKRTDGMQWLSDRLGDEEREKQKRYKREAEKTNTLQSRMPCMHGMDGLCLWVDGWHSFTRIITVKLLLRRSEKREKYSHSIPEVASEKDMWLKINQLTAETSAFSKGFTSCFFIAVDFRLSVGKQWKDGPESTSTHKICLLTSDI